MSDPWAQRFLSALFSAVVNPQHLKHIKDHSNHPVVTYGLNEREGGGQVQSIERRDDSVSQLNFCEHFTWITVLLWSCFVFVKDFFIQDINAGLKDETEIPEQLVSTWP